MKEIIQLCIIS